MPVQCLEIIPDIHCGILQRLAFGCILFFFFSVQALFVPDFLFFCKNLQIFGSTPFKDGILVQPLDDLLHQPSVLRGQLHPGVGQFIIRKDNAAFRNKSVVFQHAGKSLCQHGFTGT